MTSLQEELKKLDREIEEAMKLINNWEDREEIPKWVKLQINQDFTRITQKVLELKNKYPDLPPVPILEQIREFLKKMN